MTDPLTRLTTRDGAEFAVRRATAGDLPAIIALLADDPLGQSRESATVDDAYQQAFDAIDADPGQLLLVIETPGPAPEVVGTTVGGAPVLPIEQLPAAAAEDGIEMLIIAVPAPAAQTVAEAAVAAGITGLLNFAPTMVTVPEGVHVRHVDLASELRVLAHYTAPAQPAGIDSTDLRNTRPREHAL